MPDRIEVPLILPYSGKAGSAVINGLFGLMSVVHASRRTIGREQDQVWRAILPEGRDRFRLLLAIAEHSNTRWNIGTGTRGEASVRRETNSVDTTKEEQRCLSLVRDGPAFANQGSKEVNQKS